MARSHHMVINSLTPVRQAASARPVLWALVLVCGPLMLPAACSSAVLTAGQAAASLEGKATLALQRELEEQFQVELRSATLLDGINTNTLKVDMRTPDKTTEERVSRATRVAQFLRDKAAVPASHHRLVFDIPVIFQLGCMPISLYERIQVNLKDLKPVQVLPAQRVMVYDQFIRGEMGHVVLDDAQWNIPFFVNVNQVELSTAVMGVTAKPGEAFVSVLATWTNIGTQTATMRDDPWRLIEAAGPRKNQTVAVLDGGSTHTARNGRTIKVPPVEPGASAQRWYVFRVPLDRLTAPLAFARQRFAKLGPQEKTWRQAGFEVWVDVKNGFDPPPDALKGGAWTATTADWRTMTPSAQPPVTP